MALSRTSDQVGRVLDGRYRLIAPIGTGASGQVYLADDVRLRRRVAVKVLHPSLAADEAFLRRFQAEAQAAAALNSPHILAVYDWGHDDVPYIVTEYLGGGSLKAMLDAGFRLSLSQALLVGLEATRGLDYAHGSGFVHRDIKPANLLFGDDGRLRIADFGLARALAEAGWTEPEGAVLGTARYASPEQARGEILDGKADVYSLGLTLIEAVSGEVPFVADTTIATLMARVDAPVELDVSFGPLRRVLERACAPSRAERPDAGELAISLMAAAETLPRPEVLPLVGALGSSTVTDDVASATELGLESAEGSRSAQPAAKRRRRARPPRTRRRRWPWVVLALLLVGGAAGAGYAYTQLRTPSHEVVDFTGMAAGEVETAVAEYGWTIEQRDDRLTGSDPGSVLRQEPVAGTSLPEGPDSVLVIWVSLGNELRTVPSNLVGAPLSEASARLEEVGLVAKEVLTEAHEEVEAGSVTQVLTAASQVPEGGEVELAVSSGPRPRTVPELAPGTTYADFEALLAAEGLVPEQVSEASETVAEGVVVRTEPAAGEAVERGSTVRVIVSSGLPFIAVPNVVGMSESRAVQTLEAAGFTIGSRIGPAGRTVLATDPPAGEQRRKYSTVVVITRST